MKRTAIKKYNRSAVKSGTPVYSLKRSAVIHVSPYSNNYANNPLFELGTKVKNKKSLCKSTIEGTIVDRILDIEYNLWFYKLDTEECLFSQGILEKFFTINER